MTGYTIGEVAEKLGIPASTLRYYEQEGLLPEVTRTEGGLRRYTQAALEKLRLIECLKTSGLSIKEIVNYFHLAQDGDSTLGQRRDIFLSRRSILKEQIRRLQETLRFLNYKCWYYEMAEKFGSEQAVSEIPDTEIPAAFLKVIAHLHGKDAG